MKNGHILLNRLTQRHTSIMVEGIKGEQLINPRDIWMEVFMQDLMGKVLGALISPSSVPHQSLISPSSVPHQYYKII